MAGERYNLFAGFRAVGGVKAVHRRFVMKQDETTMAGSYQFDLAVIGAGPGGYIAAIRAAQLGMRVACIEKEPKLGGTCLRVGCIPSKTLLEASEKFTTARHHFASIGIKCPQVELDLPTMMSRKDKVVDTLSNGIAGLFKKNKIERISGTASFKSPHELTIASGGQSSTITCGKALIATGSVPIEIPSLKFNGKTIISSDQAIALAKVPERLVVVGAGAIGLELGSVWARLGSKVTVLELLPNVLPGMDEEMSLLGHDVVELDRTFWPGSAAAVHALGWPLAQRRCYAAVHELTPIYIRPPEAQEVWERRHAAAAATAIPRPATTAPTQPPPSAAPPSS